MKWLLLLVLPVAAMEFSPWFGDPFQPELRVSYRYRYYPEPFGGETLNSGIVSGAISIFDTWNAEIELAVTDSTQRGFFFDYGGLTVRHLLLDDIAGDCVSWTVGGTLTFPSKTSIRDIGTPHLGSVNLALHTAIGKEYIRGCRWIWRWWAMGAIIDSFQDAPRLAGIAALERNVYDQHFFQLALEGFVSTSGSDLPPPDRFAGYAKVQAHALDIAARYEYAIGCWGSLALRYRYRLASSNAPRRLHVVTLSLYYPISL